MVERGFCKADVVGSNPIGGFGVFDGEPLGVTEQLYVANARSKVH